jgi:hypothetical protein
MRFKSRLFPLIDVMILMLGLFLVILARATLTEDPAAQVEEPPPPARTEGGSPGSKRDVFTGLTVYLRPNHGGSTPPTWHVQEAGEPQESDKRIDSTEDWDIILGERRLEPETVVVVARIPREYGADWTSRYIDQITRWVKGKCHSIGILEH